MRLIRLIKVARNPEKNQYVSYAFPCSSPFPFGSDKPKPPEGFAQGLLVATRSGLALSVRRLIFAAEREGLLVL